jgi:hypothetical protein
MRPLIPHQYTPWARKWVIVFDDRMADQLPRIERRLDRIAEQTKELDDLRHVQERVQERVDDIADDVAVSKNMILEELEKMRVSIENLRSQ